jgi:predicted transcriptional regulator
MTGDEGRQMQTERRLRREAAARALFEAHGWTRRRIARRLGLSPWTVERYLRGAKTPKPGCGRSEYDGPPLTSSDGSYAANH